MTRTGRAGPAGAFARGRGAALAAAAIVGAGLLLRLIHLDYGLSLLEAKTWWFSRMPLAFILWKAWYFPHIYALSHLSMPVLGESEAALRLPYVLYGTLGLPFVFLIGRKLFDDRTALLSCALTAFSPYLVRFSQEARYYPLIVFYSTASLYFLLMALDPRTRRRWAYWTGFGLATALNLLTHLFALYPAVLCAATAGVFLRTPGTAAEKRGRGRTVLITGAFLAAAILVSFPAWDRALHFLRTQAASPYSLFQTTSQRIYNPGDIFVQFAVFFSGGPGLAVLFLALAAWAVAAHRRSRPRSLACAGLWVLVPPASLFVIGSYYHFEPRYFIFMLPVYLILVSAGITALAGSVSRIKRGPGYAVFALVMLPILAGDMQGLAEHYRLPESQWREALRRAGRDCSPKDVVMLYPPWSHEFITAYYPLPEGCRVLNIADLSSPRGLPAGTILDGYERIRLAARWRPSPEGRTEALAVQNFLSERREITGRERFRDIELISYREKEGARSGFPKGDGPALKEKDPAPRLNFAMLGNIPEILEASLSSRGGVLQTIGLPFMQRSLLRVIRLRERTPLRREDTDGVPRLVLIWSGSGSIEGGGFESAFHRGDIFLFPNSAAYTARGKGLAGKAVLLELSAPGARGPARMLGRAMEAPKGYSIPYSADTLQIAVHRLSPGEAARETPGRPRWPSGKLEILLQGRMGSAHIRPRKTLHLRRGDIIVFRRRQGRFHPFISEGRADLISLEVTLRRKRAVSGPPAAAYP